MPGPKEDNEKRFFFQLVERCLPHEEEDEGQYTMADRDFYVGLSVALTIVVVAGMLIRSCFD